MCNNFNKGKLTELIRRIEYLEKNSGSNGELPIDIQNEIDNIKIEIETLKNKESISKEIIPDFAMWQKPIAKSGVVVLCKSHLLINRFGNFTCFFEAGNLIEKERQNESIIYTIELKNNNLIPLATGENIKFSVRLMNSYPHFDIIYNNNILEYYYHSNKINSDSIVFEINESNEIKLEDLQIISNREFKDTRIFLPLERFISKIPDSLFTVSCSKQGICDWHITKRYQQSESVKVKYHYTEYTINKDHKNYYYIHRKSYRNYNIINNIGIAELNNNDFVLNINGLSAEPFAIYKRTYWGGKASSNKKMKWMVRDGIKDDLVGYEDLKNRYDVVSRYYIYRKVTGFISKNNNNFFDSMINKNSLSHFIKIAYCKYAKYISKRGSNRNARGKREVSNIVVIKYYPLLNLFCFDKIIPPFKNHY